MSMSSPYYTPENWGLTLVGEVEWRDESYEFDLTVVWHHKDTGRFFVESDSGCSCPVPFEGISKLADLAVYDSLSAGLELMSIEKNKRIEVADGYRSISPDAGAAVQAILLKLASDYA